MVLELLTAVYTSGEDVTAASFNKSLYGRLVAVVASGAVMFTLHHGLNPASKQRQAPGTVGDGEPKYLLSAVTWDRGPNTTDEISGTLDHSRWPTPTGKSPSHFPSPNQEFGIG